MIEKQYTRCERCKIRIDEGDTRYLITIHATADFDGSLPSKAQIEDLEAFMRKMDKSPQKKLDHDVYQSKGFVLCPRCKVEFMKNPLGEPKPEESTDESRLH